MGSPPGRLLVGRIGKPHGLLGEVHVLVVSDDPRRFAPGSRLLRDDGRTLTVASTRRSRNRALVSFEGVESRDAAEKLRGELYIEPGDERVLEAGEYWEHDLAGCDVFLIDGTIVGRVTELVPGAAQDLLAVNLGARSALVPLVQDIVVEVDVGARRVVIDPPQGLLE